MQDEKVELPSTPENASIERARGILRGASGEPKELLNLAKELKRLNEFALARRLLSLARKDSRVNEDEKLRRTIIQQQALCTYKDPDEPSADRLDRALEILAEGDSLAQTTDQETLGIAGAIHKRKWEADGQRQHLERSLGFYRRGYREGLANDYGYTAINAAYILDCLAAQEEVASESATTSLTTVRTRGEEARAIREEIMRSLPELLRHASTAWLGRQWWFNVTIAEAALGLGQYEEASTWLSRARQVPVDDWEFESTARQLAALTRVQAGKEDTLTSPAWKTIQAFLGNEAAAESKFIGKVGLALSGGGFRASLFHIGVLARLAELDLLRSVEVLSCVSGGSIIGAHYYLELRELLQSKADQEIKPEDYLAIVRRVERTFLDGVQRNIRVRIAAEWTTNIRLIFNPNYSRTHRAGELFERYIFSQVGPLKDKDPLYLNELKIEPKGEPKDFKPKYQNWRRQAKVPVLILNATSLNTGHNWQFTASFMGESPNAIDPEIDGNDRLRRMYYGDAPDAPKDYRRMRLGHAVAASACVPGVFEPLELPSLYPEMTVRLVDGGVHDNQGIAGLLEQDATFLVVSDASGQMVLQEEPKEGPIGVPLRANNILMARVRAAEFQDVRARRRAGLLRELVFVHLKRDLEVDAINWEKCPDPYDPSEVARPTARRGPLTRYGIRKDIQESLAALRTDLDCFSDAEAFALMTSGYRMIEHEFAQRRPLTGRVPVTSPEGWRFLQVQRFLDLSRGYEKGERTLLERLRVGSKVTFKVWRLAPSLQFFALVLGAIGLGVVALICWRWSATPLLTVGTLGVLFFLFIFGAILGKIVIRVVNFRAKLRRIAIGIVMSTFGFALARLHLWIFDPLFLGFGKIDNISGRKPNRLRTTVVIGFLLLFGLFVWAARNTLRQK